MSATNMKKATSMNTTASCSRCAAAALLLRGGARTPRLPGITGPDLQPDRAAGTTSPSPTGRRSTRGAMAATARHRPAFAPARDHERDSAAAMQIPGPTLIVTEGQTVTVTLTNNLPTAAGNTSILFPGFTRDRHRRAA